MTDRKVHAIHTEIPLEIPSHQSYIMTYRSPRYRHSAVVPCVH